MKNIDISKYGQSTYSFMKYTFDKIEEMINNNDKSETASDIVGGIIGSTTLLLSEALEDVYFNINSKSKEIYVNSAKQLNSLYLHAFSKGVYDVFAKPSKAYVLLAINKDDILKNAIIYNSGTHGDIYKLLRLNNDSILNISGYKFLMDYPINIFLKVDREIISAKFDFTFINPFSDLNSTFVHNTVQRINNKEYFIMKVPCKQLIKERYEYTIKDTMLKNDVFEIKFNNQLAGIRVFYKEYIDGKIIELNSKYNNMIILDDNEKFFYYEISYDELTNSGSAMIRFSSYPSHFYPKYGSSIIIDIYTTNGSQANFTYNVDLPIELTLKQNLSNKFEEALKKVDIIPQLLTSTTIGGRDMKTKEDIRRDIIRTNTSRNFIITEDQLKEFLSKDYNVKINKERDDIISREYSTYILLKHDDKTRGFIVPSRNADLIINKSSLTDVPEVDAFFLDPTTVFKPWLDKSHNINYKRFKPEDSEIKISEILKNIYNNPNYLVNYAKLYDDIIDIENDGMVMMCPFYIKIFKDPYILGIYNLFNSKKYGTIFKYNDPYSVEKYSIPTLYFDRSDIYRKSYNISIDLVVSENMKNLILNYDSSTSDFPIKIRIEMLDENDNPLHFFDLYYRGLNPNNPEMFIFETDLNTYDVNNNDAPSDVLHRDDMIKIYNRREDNPYNGVKNEFHGCRPLNSVEYPASEEDRVPYISFIPFKTKFVINILTLMNDVRSDEEIYKEYLLSTTEILKMYRITDVFTISETIEFVKDYSDVFNSGLNIYMSEGVLPTYNEDVYSKYSEPVFMRDSDGNYIIDENGEIQVEPGKNIGDFILDENGNKIILHKKGEEKRELDQYGKLIYKIPPEPQFIITDIPIVSLISMMYKKHKYFIYETFDKYVSYLKNEILLKLISNYKISTKVFNTIGRSNFYEQGFSNNYSQLTNIDISIKLYIKLIDKTLLTDETLSVNIKSYIENYIVNSLQNGMLNVNNLIMSTKETFNIIHYMEFGTINGVNDVQTIRLRDNSITEDNTPEHITIKYKLDRTSFIRNNGEVILIPAIDIIYI